MFNQLPRILLSLALLIVTLSATAAPLNITEAWIKDLPPAVPMRAGYLTMENQATTTVKLTAVESEVFTRIEVHETIEKDGMMSMRPLSPLVLSANSVIKLAPGGIHLMMMRPKVDIKLGDLVDVTFHFDDGNTQTIQMTVRK